MSKIAFRKNRISLWALFIAADLFIFFLPGLLLMGYDDHYDESKGGYWSLASMNSGGKVTYITYCIWNIFNLVVFFFVLWKIYDYFAQSKQ